MGIIGGRLGYWILRGVAGKQRVGTSTDDPYAGKSKAEVLFGCEFWNCIRGKTVIDFGCGEGREAVAMAKAGARQVVGIDVRQSVLDKAQALAGREGVAEKCHFTTNWSGCADVLVSIDSFEHFSDPAAVLTDMSALLSANGCVWISFGPTWYHPLGGHLFSVFPWAHLIFTEAALIAWRSDFKTDGARHFHEVEGGLNQMTIRRFEEIVKASTFQLDVFRLVPIRIARPLWCSWTREWLTSVVQCKLTRQALSDTGRLRSTV